jgi:hypothetical protein
MHGHLHYASDYVVEGAQGRRCRVVCNPLGYAAKGEQDAFRPHLLVEVVTSRTGTG